MNTVNGRPWNDKLNYRMEKYQEALFKKLDSCALPSDDSRGLFERQEEVLERLTIRTRGVDVQKRTD